MKPISTLSLHILLATVFAASSAPSYAQQYKMRQVTTVSGMKSESTIYVRGARKRTEGGGYAGMTNLTTIEQCDLQRTIRINDKKKLYFIEPFLTENEEAPEAPAKVSNTHPVTPVNKAARDTKGGTIYLYYNITDTGERRKMHGVTARHVWSTQKMKPSADACMMKDSLLIKTDGWYIDLPQFNCPVTNFGQSRGAAGGKMPDCRDRFVSKRTGKGRLGFPLIEKRTIIMGSAASSVNEFETNLETVEFVMTPLDSMLFEIPAGYREAGSEEELQDRLDMAQMMQQAGQRQVNPGKGNAPGNQKTPGTVRIGVYEPKTSEAVHLSAVRQELANTLSGGNIEIILLSSAEDAGKYKCDWVVNSELTKLTQGSKVGSFLKALRNTAPSAVSSFNVEATIRMERIDGSDRREQKITGKFEGKADEAAAHALGKGVSALLKEMD